MEKRGFLLTKRFEEMLPFDDRTWETPLDKLVKFPIDMKFKSGYLGTEILDNPFTTRKGNIFRISDVSNYLSNPIYSESVLELKNRVSAFVQYSKKHKFSLLFPNSSRQHRYQKDLNRQNFSEWHKNNYERSFLKRNSVTNAYTNSTYIYIEGYEFTILIQDNKIIDRWKLEAVKLRLQLAHNR